ISGPDDLLLALILIAFTAIELRYSLLEKFKGHRAEFFGGRMVRPYLLYSVALAVAMWFTFVLYVSYDKNLLVLRQFDLGSVFGTGHWFTWVIMAVVLTRWGWNDIVSGLFIVGAFSALHEMVWYVFDGLTYPGQL